MVVPDYQCVVLTLCGKLWGGIRVGGGGGGKYFGQQGRHLACKLKLHLPASYTLKGKGNHNTNKGYRTRPLLLTFSSLGVWLSKCERSIEASKICNIAIVDNLPMARY